ncbi:transglutaminase domain-containing protein [Lysinibacillus mangiferihumi]|uniref:Transglutaminase domain-containing protein n=1 Tax=Lysinibacillus mangiferihumi TaxID=1130819 RepID=A0A4U2Z4L2_9BACI|nr:transglutaminase-like domain-containing protein [Lysinibacillus mangiferihumi]TKI67721.1 transglutaminase domain-containing protein [Lysinibacillus mangiferihumi]
MTKTVTVDFLYKNELFNQLQLWMIIPPAIQSVYEMSTIPVQVTEIPTGEQLAYYILNKNEYLHLDYEVELYSTKNEKKTLTEEERDFYLRNTMLSPINKEMTKLAQEITFQQENAKEKARAIFHYIVKNYRYVYPPSCRGVKSFLELKEGDCGEFSFLFTALCRALNIPARTVVGSWAYGEMNAHVWNEFFIEGKGWIPVDTSMAYMQKKRPWSFLGSSIKTIYWKKYFGKTEGQRVVFSKDAEIKLLPEYKDDEEAIIAAPMNINGENFGWGQQSLNGCAPYLQPIYIKFELNESHSTLSVVQVMGTWTIQEHGFKQLLAVLKKPSLIIAIVAMLLNFIVQNFYLEVTFKLSFILFLLCFILRMERMIIFSIMLLFMSLSLFSTLDGR